MTVIINLVPEIKIFYQMSMQMLQFWGALLRGFTVKKNAKIGGAESCCTLTRGCCMEQMQHMQHKIHKSTTRKYQTV